MSNMKRLHQFALLIAASCFAVMPIGTNTKAMAANLEVIKAIYGANCRWNPNELGSRVGRDVTAQARAYCESNRTTGALCEYPIDHRVIGDPSKGCLKQFQVWFRCTDNYGGLPNYVGYNTVGGAGGCYGGIECEASGFRARMICQPQTYEFSRSGVYPPIPR